MRAIDFLYVNTYKMDRDSKDPNAMKFWDTLIRSEVFKVRHIVTGVVLPAVICYRQRDRLYNNMVMIQRASIFPSTDDLLDLFLRRLSEIGQSRQYGCRSGDYGAKRQKDRPQESYSIAEFDSIPEYENYVGMKGFQYPDSARYTLKSKWSGVVLSAHMALRLNGFEVVAKTVKSRRIRLAKNGRKTVRV